MSTSISGSCLCGAVRYSVPDEFHAAFNCHCSLCRRATGAAFKPMAAIRFDKITLTQGQADVLIYGDRDGSHDVHCRHCGSFLYSHIAANGNGHVAMGTLIDTPSIKPQFHMFVGSKAPWHEITDDLPQFEGLPV
jgi:hypothetical protein